MDYEIEMLPVGDSNGDAICVRYGTPDAFRVHLIDGGFTDTSDAVVNHVREYYGRNTSVDHALVSHGDNDHACGLIGALKSLPTRNIWMHRPWLYAPQIVDSFHGNWTLAGLTKYIRDSHEYLVEFEAIANLRQIPIYAPFAGRRIGEGFVVLAPSEQRYISLLHALDKSPPSYKDKKGLLGAVLGGARNVLDVVREAWDIETLDENPPATSASNETSVVQMGVFGAKRALLTADVGPDGLREAAQYARAMGLFGSPNFVQVPHHGSRRNVTPSVLNEWLGAPLEDRNARRGVAFCSVGKDADIYPRKKVKNAFMRRGYPVHATRGWTKRHHSGGVWGERAGWKVSEPEAFDPNVGEED